MNATARVGDIRPSDERLFIRIRCTVTFLATPLFKYPLLLALALAFASPSALADRGDRRFGGRGDDRASGWQRQQQEGQPPSRPRDLPPPGFQRSDGADAQRHPRLSPEERRQLRRDIQDAGREIYPPRR